MKYLNSGIIKQSGTCSPCGWFIYNGGNVSYLNNGFEYLSDASFSPFLYAENLQSAVFTGVNFSYNFVLSGAQLPGLSSSLISIQNVEILRINSCGFDHNLATSALISIQSNLKLPIDPNAANVTVSYTLLHIDLSSLSFHRNFAIGGIIGIVISGNILNVALKDIEFLEDSSLLGSSFSIKNVGKMPLDAVSGGWQNFKVNKTKEKLYLTQRYLNVSGVSFTSESSFSSIIAITGYPNVKVSNVTWVSNGDVGKRGYNDVISEYMSGLNIYMNLTPDLGPNQLCSGMLTLQQVTNLAFSLLNLTSNVCEAGSAGISFLQVSGNSSISGVSAYRNSAANFTGTVFNAVSALLIALDSLYFEGNINSAGSVLLFAGGGNVSLTSSRFIGNSGNRGGVVYMDKAGILKISGAVFKGNTAFSGLAGAIFFGEMGTGSPALMISGTSFGSNSAGQGGAIYIQGSSPTVSLFLQVLNTTFDSNSANTTGAAFFIDSNVGFRSNSVISSCVFLRNTSPTAVINFQQTAGAILVTGSTFNGNSGSISAGIQIETGSGASVLLSSLSFTSNSGGPVILKPNSRISSVFSTLSCTFSSNSATGIYMEGGSWTDQSSTFSSCQGTAISMVSGALSQATKTVFSSNTNTNNGGAVYLGSKSSLKCINCQFLKNIANGSGGAVFLEQDSTISLKNCLFDSNIAGGQGGAIFLLSSLTVPPLIQQSIFRFNTAGTDGTISALNSGLKLEAVSLYQNLAITCPGVSLLLSDLVMTNCTFQSQSGSVSAFLSLQTSSTANVSSSFFSDGTSQMAGGILVTGSSLNIYQSTFLRLTGQKAGILSAGTNSNVTISGVSVKTARSTGGTGLILITDSFLSIFNSTFADFSLGGIVGNQLSGVNILLSNFSNGGGTLGAAVFCVLCASVKIDFSRFENLTADVGGAVYLYSSDVSMGNLNASIENCVFRNNTAETGGAMYVDNTWLIVDSSTYEGNNAPGDNGQGGGLYLDCSKPSFCGYSISNTSFIGNIAGLQGGGVYWSSIQPSLSPTVKMLQNSAPYGPGIASFAISLQLLNISQESGRVLLVNPELNSTAPGQVSDTKVVAGLIDHYGQIVNIDSTSTAELTSSNESFATVSGVSKVRAVSGVFEFQGFAIFADPTSTVGIQMSTDGISRKEGMPNVGLKFQMRDCVPGESLAAKSCLVCVTGTYGFNPSQPCQDCPQNAKCLGNFTVFPDSGYWRSGNLSSIIRLCPNPAACLGGFPINQSVSLTGACAIGYTGNLCQSCQEDFSHSSINTCELCPDLTLNIVKLGLIGLAVIVVLAILVWSSLKSANRPAALHSIYLRIFMNYLQLVLLTTEFKLNWPSPVLQLFSTQEAVGGVSEQAISVDCFLAGNKSASDAFYRKMMIIAGLPLILIIAASGFWGLVALYKRKVSLLSRELAATVVILFFLIHPTLVKMVFSMFSCLEIDPGQDWLTVDMAIRCWDDTHLMNIFTVGLPAIIIWVIGVPLLCLSVLIRARHKLDDIRIKMPFGFLYNGYKKRKFYWEFVILYRKIVIICCAVFLTDDISVQALTVQIVLLIALFLQYDINPYFTPKLNEMELRAILVAGITIYCGLYYITNDLSIGSSWFFFISISGMNLAFIIYWLKAMGEYILEVVAESVRCVGHKVNPELYDKDEEMEELLEIFENRRKKVNLNLHNLHDLHMTLLKSLQTLPCSAVPVIKETMHKEKKSRNTETAYSCRDYQKTTLTESLFELPEQGQSFSFEGVPRKPSSAAEMGELSFSFES